MKQQSICLASESSELKPQYCQNDDDVDEKYYDVTAYSLNEKIRWKNLTDQRSGLL